MSEPTQPEGLNPDGTLKPPTGHEQTEVKAEGLANPSVDLGQPRMLTLDESDLLRAERAFKFVVPSTKEKEIFELLNSMALELSKVIIVHCPPSKERSQSLGNVQQVVMWAIESIKNRKR